MNKKVLIGIVVVVLIAAIIGTCFLLLNNNNKGAKTVELNYKSNGGVPYKWEYTIEDPSIVKLEETKVIDDQNKDGMVGAPITTSYIFKGLKEGTTTVTFKYVSVVDGSVDKEEKTTMKVDKNLSITAEANK